MTLPPLLWSALILAAAAPVVYWIGMLADPRTPARKASWSQPAALLALLVSWIPFLSALSAPAARAEVMVGAIQLQTDAVSLLLAGTALGLSTLVVVYSRVLIQGEPGETHYYSLLLLMTAGIVGLGLTLDLFHLWLWFEAMTLASYFLVGFHFEERGALEAAVKYLAQSTAGSVLIILGTALLLLQTGTLDLSRLAGPVFTPGLNAAAALCLVGFGVKAALVPLHTWLPDAHSQAPSGISAMLSGIVIEAGLVAAIRVIAPFAAAEPAWGWLLAGLGGLNLLVGNLMAMRQHQVKRMLAYSSVSQIGYMLLGLGFAFALGQPLAAQGAFLHLLNHGVMKGLAFLAAGLLLFALQRQAPPGHILSVDDLAGTASRFPLIAAGFSIAVLGLAGLPPLAGFMSKWQIGLAGALDGSAWATAMVVFAALNSVLSLAYYAPLVNVLYRRQPSPFLAGSSALALSSMLPLAALTCATILVGLWPGILEPLTTAAGRLLVTP